MKKLIWIFAGLITVSLLYSYLTVQADDSATGEYMIISYSPYSIGTNKKYVYVNAGDKFEEILLTKDEGNHTSQFISKLMTRYSSEGYDLVSTTSGTSGEIYCFMKRTK